MAGGLFAIERKWFFESGAYDEGMKVRSFYLTRITCATKFCSSTVVCLQCYHSHGQMQAVEGIHKTHLRADLGRREPRDVIPTVDVRRIDRDPALLPRGPHLQRCGCACAEGLWESFVDSPFLFLVIRATNFC